MRSKGIPDNLSEWFDEFRMYHRKDGKLVKLNDDLMSATRYAVQSLRHAKTENWTRTNEPIEYENRGIV